MPAAVAASVLIVVVSSVVLLWEMVCEFFEQWVIKVAANMLLQIAALKPDNCCTVLIVIEAAQVD